MFFVNSSYQELGASTGISPLLTVQPSPLLLFYQAELLKQSMDCQLGKPPVVDLQTDTPLDLSLKKPAAVVNSKPKSPCFKKTLLSRFNCKFHVRCMNSWFVTLFVMVQRILL